MPKRSAKVSYARRLRSPSSTLLASENVARTPPSGFADDPDPRVSRSSTTTSATPASARWKAMLAPMMPPPTTTTSAAAGSGVTGVANGTTCSSGSSKRVSSLMVTPSRTSRCQAGTSSADWSGSLPAVRIAETAGLALSWNRSTAARQVMVRAGAPRRRSATSSSGSPLPSPRACCRSPVRPSCPTDGRRPARPSLGPTGRPARTGHARRRSPWRWERTPRIARPTRPDRGADADSQWRHRKDPLCSRP